MGIYTKRNLNYSNKACGVAMIRCMHDNDAGANTG